MNTTIDLKQMQQSAEVAAGVLKSLSHPQRLLLLCALDTRPHSVSELEQLTGLSQSSVSQHLARLRREGIVDVRKDAQRNLYALKSREVAVLLQTLQQVFCAPMDSNPASTRTC